MTQMPIGIWFLLAIGGVIAVLALIGYLSGAWDQPLPP
jgi:hypothetical protein